MGIACRGYTIRLALGVALTCFGIFLRPLAPPFAAAQIRGLLDLNGVWELEDRGDRGERPESERVLVRITHSGSTIQGQFISGAECYDGTPRPYAFRGQLSIPVPGRPVSFVGKNTIWACSGSPILVQQCDNSTISHMYETTFKGGAVEQNLITADRVLQGVRDCQLDPASNGTFRFTLKRIPPCEDAERKVAEREAVLRNLLDPILDARGIFTAAFHAAQQRYGDTYNGGPTETLRYPYLVMATKWEFNSESTERFFELLPRAVVSDEWTKARVMVADLALLATDSLPEAVRMLEKIYEIENKAIEGQRALDSLRNARQDLEACRWAHSPAP